MRVWTEIHAGSQATPTPIPFHLVVRWNSGEVRGPSATINSTGMLSRDPLSGYLQPIAGDTGTMSGLNFTTAADWLEFLGYVQLWKRETAYLSMVEDMVLSEAYQRIIGMGPKAIPLILRQIENEGANPDHWWWALRVLARHDPVPPEHKGNIAEMARCWLEWFHEDQLAS